MEKQTIEYSRRENLLGCVTFDLLKNYRQQSSKLIDIIRLGICSIALAVKHVDSEILVRLADIEASLGNVALGGIYRLSSSATGGIAYSLGIRALDINLAVLNVKLLDHRTC